MKKFYVTILTFILALSFNVVSANTINSIKMDIFVDDFGDAYVTEVWNCYPGRQAACQPAGTAKTRK